MSSFLVTHVLIYNTAKQRQRKLEKECVGDKWRNPTAKASLSFYSNAKQDIGTNKLLYSFYFIFKSKIEEKIWSVGNIYKEQMSN